MGCVGLCGGAHTAQGHVYDNTYSHSVLCTSWYLSQSRSRSRIGQCKRTIKWEEESSLFKYQNCSCFLTVKRGMMTGFLTNDGHKS